MLLVGGRLFAQEQLFDTAFHTLLSAPFGANAGVAIASNRAIDCLKGRGLMP